MAANKTGNATQVNASLPLVTRILSCPEDARLENQVIACRTVVISPDVMKVKSSVALLPGMLLGLQAEAGEPPLQYSLVGRVTKTVIVEHACLFVVQLLPGDTTHHDLWVALFDENFGLADAALRRA